MRSALHNYFIPHEGNGYRPPAVHTKRTVTYSTLFVALKLLLVVFAVSVPSGVYLHPDVLGQQYRAVIALTNDIRASQGLPAVTVVGQLNESAVARANDMARHEYFSHTGPDSRTLSYFLKQSGYQYAVAGENLAMGFSDAAAVVAAWKRSPAHYRNLVDPDFTELGVGLSAGNYQGEETIYIAEHFGTPPGGLTAPLVAGQKIVDQRWVSVDTGASRAFWKDEGGRTTVVVRAKIDGAVESAEANFADTAIPLTETESGWFAGEATLDGSVRDLFYPALTLPTVSATDPTGETVTEAVNWFNRPHFSATPWTAYTQAKRFLGSVTPVFAVSRAVFAAAAVLFAVALALFLAVEFRRAHRRLAFQTAGMLVLLLVLWWV